MEPGQAQADSSATAVETGAEGAVAADTTTSQPDISGLTLEQIDTIMTGGSVEVPVVGAAAEPTPKETPPEKAEKPDAKAGGPEAGKETVVEGEEPAGKVDDEPSGATGATGATGADPEIERIQRPRLKNPVDQQIAAVFKAAESSGEPISWAEAERRIKGDPTPPAKKEEVVLEPAPDYGQEVATLTDEVQKIRDRLTELGEAEGLLTPEYSKLSIELADKAADLKLAKRDLVQAEKDAKARSEKIKTESDTARSKARATAIDRWPDAGDDATPLGKAVAARIALLKNPEHPDHAILYADSAPLTIVRDVADEMGIAPRTVKKEEAAAPPTPARKVVSPTPGNKTSVPAVKPTEDAKLTLDYARTEASLEELDAAFGAGDMSKTLAHVIGR